MIGRELAAAGLGFDIAGALFLGWGMVRSPTFVASELLTDSLAIGEVRPGINGLTINTLKLQEFAEGMLFGRAGLAALFLGFVLQLVGLIVPSAPHDWLLPALFGILCLLLSLRTGSRWVRRNFAPLAEEI